MQWMFKVTRVTQAVDAPPVDYRRVSALESLIVLEPNEREVSGYEAVKLLRRVCTLLGNLVLRLSDL